MQNIVGLIVLASVAWVAIDASKRDWTDCGFADAAWKWVVGMLLLWFVALPLYVFKYRRQAPPRRTPGGPVGPPSGPTAAFATPEKPASVPPPSMK